MAKLKKEKTNCWFVWLNGTTFTTVEAKTKADAYTISHRLYEKDYPWMEEPTRVLKIH